MGFYRKKPVVIEAVKWTGENQWEIDQFCQAAAGWRGPHQEVLYIVTLGEEHLVSKGDMIIRGIAGEFYPCKPDIFEDTYDCVEDDPEFSAGDYNTNTRPHRG